MPTIDDLKQMFSREHTSFDTWSHSRGGGTSSSPPPRGSLTQSPRAGHDTRGGGGGAAGPPLRSSLSPPATVHEDDEEGVEFPALNDGAYAVQDLRAYRRSWDSDQNFPIKEIERIKKKTKKLRSSREPIFRSDDFENHEAKAAAFAAIAHEPTRNNSGSLSHDGSSVRHRRTVRTLTSGSSKTRDTLAEVLDMDLSTTDGDMSEDVKQVSPEPSPKPVEPRAAVVEPSPRAHEAKQALMMGFHKRGRHRSTDESSNGVFNTSVRTEETNTTDDNASKDLALHDLVGEAVTVDDIAWRNALHLLSVEPHLAFVSDHGWTPLHICCIGSSPPPTFMVRALLYTNKAASKQPDEGGRLPLHLIAASSADVDTMQLLVEEHPEALHQTDEHGLTPLHLLLRNLQVSLTVDRARILLGLTLPRSMDEQVRQRSVLLRRRDHLNMGFEELGRMLHKTPPVTTFRKDVDHEMNFDKYPSDIQTALRRLSQWKRKQHFVDDSAELEVPLTGGETNPAAIPSPGNLHLPIHALVRRALVDRPLLEPHASRRVQYDGEGKDEEVYDQEVRSEAEQVPIKNPYDLLRMFVASYPEGLVVRDNDGYTPLMLLMMESDTLPSLDVLDVLLGKRTAGYESIPSWAQDLPLHRLSTHHSVNPAMVPTVESQSLPLHVAAEELLVDDSLIRTIYESYPGAIQVQDALGRTPLHIALRSYRKIPANPQVMELLYSDHVAKIRDDHSRIPFDLLLESAQNLPEKRPASWSDTKSGSSASTVYQRFISASVADTKPSNRKEAVRFLRRLRLLPPWLRKEACASSVVQDLLVEDLASPVKCALILLDGILLVALITVFRVQLESYVDALNKDDVLATWYTFAVYGIATTRLLLEVAFWMAAASFGEFQHLFLFNIWTWIGAGAMLLAIIASVLIFGSLEENHVFAIGTAATGLLWLNLLGYLTTWSHGVSLFVGGLAKVSNDAYSKVKEGSPLTCCSRFPVFLSGHSYCSGVSLLRLPKCSTRYYRSTVQVQSPSRRSAP